MASEKSLTSIWFRGSEVRLATLLLVNWLEKHCLGPSVVIDQIIGSDGPQIELTALSHANLLEKM